jgi:hypothetical protein
MYVVHAWNCDRKGVGIRATNSVLLVMFVAQISTSFSIPVPRMYMLLLLTFLLYPAELAWSRVTM